MEADSINAPEAFTAADEKARLECLRSLIIDQAADDLEKIFKGWKGSLRPNGSLSSPSPLENPPSLE